MAEVYKKVWCPTNEVRLFVTWIQTFSSSCGMPSVLYLWGMKPVVVCAFKGGANENYLSNERAAGRCHWGIHRVTGLNHRLALFSFTPDLLSLFRTTEEKNINLSSLLTDEEEDDEEVYKMAGVMAQCGGLECMLNRLSGIKDFKQGRHLLTVRKIISHSVSLTHSDAF